MANKAERIHWLIVEGSSNIDKVGWDKNGRMYVRFLSGAMYAYEGVSRQRAVAAARAQSVGGYINRVIKPNYKAVSLA